MLMSDRPQIEATDSNSNVASMVGPRAMVATIAGLKFLLHMLAAAKYGLFTDELYFLACGEHLAWGYVDMPPLTAVQAWLARTLLGDSPYAIHFLPALAGAALVLMVGAMVRQLGGGRWAQVIAALAAATAPGCLAFDAYLSMNSIEIVLVAGLAMILIRIVQTADTRLWLGFGAVAGIGLLNKQTIGLFGFGLVFSLVFTDARRLMFNRWFLAGGAVAFVIFLPHLVWMWQHHFPHLELLANIRRNQRNVSLSPLAFLAQQVLLAGPLLLPLWLAGLWHFVAGEGKQLRPLGLAYLIALVVLIVADSRVYYLLPAYPMLFAGGAVAMEKLLGRRSRRWVKPAYGVLIVITGAMFAPLAMPLLEPETYIKYTGIIGFKPPRIENRVTSALPQLFADRFGWPEMARVVADAYHAIPEPERGKTAIFGQNYGEAGAIDSYGPKMGLPKSISGHLSYWYWGPRDYTGEIMLVMGDRREVLEQKFDSVEKVGEVGHPYAMASEHWELFLCRGPKGWKNLQEIWPQLKNWN
jgi:Dolichyl-phosphate-mannose-protein mannosyltransferase